ncbi:MAG: hypothetical protein LBU91_00165 [Bacteroidales bacterium]|nr:hypothetical protein [Bacteroidales bacterium]
MVNSNFLLNFVALINTLTKTKNQIKTEPRCDNGGSKIMKKLSIEQMEQVNGGGRASNWCAGLMGGWSFLLSVGAALAPVTAGVSIGISGVATGLSVGLCALVAMAE